MAIVVRCEPEAHDPFPGRFLTGVGVLMTTAATYGRDALEGIEDFHQAKDIGIQFPSQGSLL